MSEGLSAEELAYMRATQAAYRPTEAALERRVSTRTATGAQTDTWPTSEPVQVRIATAPDKVPAPIAAKYGVSGLAKVTMDRVFDVRDGDRLRVSPTEVYQVVTEGDPSEWSTAQQVWAKRTVFPAR